MVIVVLERGGESPSLCNARADGSGGRVAGCIWVRGVECPWLTVTL